MSKLYVVSTPIGNLGDVSSRALEILRSVNFILCEDTRVTKKLLNFYQISTPLISYHQHTKLNKIDKILELLARGNDLALVSDAGTPGISDPGNKLIEEIVVKIPEVKIEPIPGPSAVTALASVSGFFTDKFLFLGFPPMKKKRKAFFQEVVDSKYSVIFYESPYRIIKSLEELKQVNPNLKIVVGRELTKKFETIYRGTVAEVLEKIIPEQQRGEFVIAVSK